MGVAFCTVRPEISILTKRLTRFPFEGASMSGPLNEMMKVE